MKEKRLITSALPYANNVPHLGNLIQVLSADVYARFCRNRGYDTLYVCGTDEYGTATETKAREQGLEPGELCQNFFLLHRDIYQWFCISFDRFGRTATPEHTRIVQSIFWDLHKGGFIDSATVEQFYSEISEIFLADRYITGTCPICDYEHARGDQCENCGTLLEPTQLKKPRSKLDNSEPVLKKTTHLYINLPKLRQKLENWLNTVKQGWSRNAIKMTEAWIRDGLKSRAITRDLKWGIPVPLEGFTNKVFYVWFDAPIGYISITATLTENWETWWKNPEEVKLVQFIGKDNIPFHTVIFPSSLLASTKPWTLLKQMSSTEFLNYEGGAFSKSRGIGVFGSDVIEIGLPADMWRFYLFYNRPENADHTFVWKDFQEGVNSILINNLSNLYSRTLAFQHRYFGPELIQHDAYPEESAAIWKEIEKKEERIIELMERTELRSAYRMIFELSGYGNKLFQSMEPWKLHNEDPQKTSWLIRALIYLLRDLALLIEPFTPGMSANILRTLCPQSFNRKLVSEDSADRRNPQFYAQNYRDFNWSRLRKFNDIKEIAEPKHLFKRLDDAFIAELSKKYHGKQQEEKTMDALKHSAEDGMNKELCLSEQFAKKVEIRVAKVLEVSLHPEADKLYVLKLEDGSPDGRSIVTGLRPYYAPEELQGQKILLVANLKPAKFRGVVSNGMLLAAEEEQGQLEVVFANEHPVGTQILPEGCSPPDEYQRLKIEKFFEFPLHVHEYQIMLDKFELLGDGKSIKTKKLSTAKVG